MMRTAIIGDLHLGKTLYGYDLTSYVRRAMYEFLDLCRFVEVKAAVCLGDIYDRPAPTIALQKVVVQWANEFELAGIDLYLLSGNHDATSNHAAPTALESLRVAAPFRHVRVIDRPTVVDGVGALLPFPSPAIFESNAEYEAAVAELVPQPFAFSHLNVDGAKLGEQEFLYRGADHTLPLHVGEVAVFAGHIHKPQRVGKVCVVGAAERTSFAEKDEPRHFVLIPDRWQGKAVHYVRPLVLPLVRVELDASSWGGQCLTTEDVVRENAERVRGAMVKVTPFVDDRTAVDWGRVVAEFQDAGAVHVFMEPAIRVASAKQRRKTGLATADPAVAASKYIRQRIADKQERKRLLRLFKRMQKETDHGEEV